MSDINIRLRAYALPDPYDEREQETRLSKLLKEAAGEIESLTAERAELAQKGAAITLQRDQFQHTAETATRECSRLSSEVISKLIAERDALTARVAELERDADRYRWLRDASLNHRIDPPVATLIPSRGIKVSIQYPGAGKCMPECILSGVSLDAAIDAARNVDKEVDAVLNNSLKSSVRIVRAGRILKDDSDAAREVKP